MNHRMGKLKQIDKLDGSFFGIHERLGNTIDPHSRILLETTYEAIVDAGMHFILNKKYHDKLNTNYLSKSPKE